MIEQDPTDPLTPGGRQPTANQVRSALQGYRNLFEDPPNRAALSNVELLQYWRGQMSGQNGFNACILHDTILCFFSIPATSAPSERAFMQGSCILSPMRSLITPDNLDEMITIKGFMSNGQFQNFNEILALMQ